MLNAIFTFEFLVKVKLTPPNGGVRPFHQKSTCLTRLTFWPNVVRIRSRITPESGPNKTLALHLVVTRCRAKRDRVNVFHMKVAGSHNENLDLAIGVPHRLTAARFEKPEHHPPRTLALNPSCSNTTTSFPNSDLQQPELEAPHQVMDQTFLVYIKSGWNKVPTDPTPPALNPQPSTPPYPSILSPHLPSIALLLASQTPYASTLRPHPPSILQPSALTSYPSHLTHNPEAKPKTQRDDGVLIPRHSRSPSNAILSPFLEP